MSKNKINTQLIDASEKGHVDTVRKLLTSGADVNTATEDGMTSLYIASAEGHIDVVKELLKGGADVAASSDDGQSPLYVASSEGRIAIVKELLKHGADVNAPKNNGATPLYIASQNGHLDIVKELLERGADVNAATNDGSTPLFIASAEGNIDIVKELLKHGADVNARENSVDVNAQDNDGWTPLFIASQNGNLDVVKELLERGADVNARCNGGNTPLDVASMEGYLAIVKELLERRADVNARKDNGATPLYSASAYGHLDVVKELLERGADVNAVTAAGKTPLMIAIEKNRIGVIRFLKKNTSIDSKKWKGFTKADIEKFDTVFEENAANYAVCPVCLEYVERSEACMYMQHNCTAVPGYYHMELYDKYKNSDGLIGWCTICGRITIGHSHYDLVKAQGGKATTVRENDGIVIQGDPYEDDCSDTNGGGGPQEKLARFRRLREYALELQDDIDKKDEEEALDELVEEVWNAPLRPEKKLLTGIRNTKKWNHLASNFPNTRRNNKTNAPNIPFTGKLPTQKNSGTNMVMMNKDVPVLEFHHKQPNGTVKDHAVTIETLEGFIEGNLRNPSERAFGYCFMYPGACKSLLHPTEIKGHVSDDLYEKYKKNFNVQHKKKTGIRGMSVMGGGTRTRNRNVNGAHNIFRKMTDGECVMPQRKTRKNTRKN